MAESLARGAREGLCPSTLKKSVADFASRTGCDTLVSLSLSHLFSLSHIFFLTLSTSLSHFHSHSYSCFQVHLMRPAVGVLPAKMTDFSVKKFVRFSEDEVSSPAPTPPAARSDCRQAAGKAGPPKTPSEGSRKKRRVEGGSGGSKVAGAGRKAAADNGPLEAAREALRSIATSAAALQAEAAHWEARSGEIDAQMVACQEGLGKAKEETTAKEEQVAKLSALMTEAKEGLQSSKDRERSWVEMIDRAVDQEKEAKAERERSLARLSAAEKAQKHLEESVQYLEQMMGGAGDGERDTK